MNCKKITGMLWLIVALVFGLYQKQTRISPKLNVHINSVLSITHLTKRAVDWRVQHGFENDIYKPANR